MSKMRQWALLTAVACLAVIAAGWYVVIKPERSSAASYRTQAQGVQSKNTQLRDEIAQLRDQQKALPAQQQKLASIATKIPDNPALPALIRQLSAAADGAGVNLVSMAPGQPTLGRAAAATTSAAAGSASGAAASSTAGGAGSTPASPLAIIPLSLQVQGSYFNVEQFFSAVESLSRAMLVTGFTLNPAGGTSGSGGAAPASADANALPPGTLTAQITASVFESPQLAAAAATTTATSTTGH